MSFPKQTHPRHYLLAFKNFMEKLWPSPRLHPSHFNHKPQETLGIQLQLWVSVDVLYFHGCKRTWVKMKCGTHSCKHHCKQARGCSLHPAKHPGSTIPFPTLQIASPITPQRPTQTLLNDELLLSISPKSQQYLMAKTSGAPNKPFRFPSYEYPSLPMHSHSLLPALSQAWSQPQMM